MLCCYTQTYSGTYAYIHTCMYTYIYAYTHIYIFIKYVYIETHICIHIYVYVTKYNILQTFNSPFTYIKAEKMLLENKNGKSSYVMFMFYFIPYKKNVQLLTTLFSVYSQSFLKDVLSERSSFKIRSKKKQSSKCCLTRREMALRSCIPLFTETGTRFHLSRKQKCKLWKNGLPSNWQVQIRSVISESNWPFNVLSEKCFKLLILSTSPTTVIFLNT